MNTAPVETGLVELGELRAHKKRNGRIFYLRSELDVWRHR